MLGNPEQNLFWFWVGVVIVVIMMNYDIEVAWQLNDVCDFDCTYCWLHKRGKKDKPSAMDNYRTAVDTFRKTGYT